MSEEKYTKLAKKFIEVHDEFWTVLNENDGKNANRVLGALAIEQGKALSNTPFNRDEIAKFVKYPDVWKTKATDISFLVNLKHHSDLFFWNR